MQVHLAETGCCSMNLAVPRALFLLLLTLLALGTCQQTEAPPRNVSQVLSAARVALPSRSILKRDLGAFTLEGAWHLDSPHTDFGSYSAMVALGDGPLLAISDLGRTLRFSPPGAPPSPTEIGTVFAGRDDSKELRDLEAAAYDPASGHIWVALEGRNIITRHDDIDFERFTIALLPAMRGWGGNSGAEAMARLAGGRFLLLREGFDGTFERERHRGLLFPSDPVEGSTPVVFTFAGPAGFSPTEVAPLPDGRVLILMRRLVWPFPARFSGRIAIADPRKITAGGVWRAREVAVLGSPLPVDNFEGLAIEPQRDGRINLWMISDDNGAALQRTLLWKLSVDPKRL